MSYSTDPIEDAARHFEPLYRAAEAQEQAEANMAAAFIRDAALGDAKALAPWAPNVADRQAIEKLPLDQRASAADFYRRAQSLHEVMFEALDYRSGPAMADAMQLILTAAESSDRHLANMARDLLDSMAVAYARAHAEAE